MKTFETERLIVAPLSMQFRHQYVDLMMQPQVMRYIDSGIPLTRQQALSNLNYLMAQNELHDYGFWAVFIKAGNQFAGRVDLYDPQRLPQHELGWMLLPEFWGKGYALEAAKVIKAEFFSHNKGQSLLSYIQPDNRFSIKIAQQLGGIFVEDVVLAGRHHYKYQYFR